MTTTILRNDADVQFIHNGSDHDAARAEFAEFAVRYLCDADEVDALVDSMEVVTIDFDAELGALVSDIMEDAPPTGNVEVRLLDDRYAGCVAVLVRATHAADDEDDATAWWPHELDLVDPDGWDIDDSGPISEIDEGEHRVGVWLRYVRYA